MAKIFKISGYLVDPVGDYQADYLRRDISAGYDMIGQHIHVEEASIGEWDDESPLNYDNCDLAECEKYFKRKVPVDNDRNVIAGQVYRHFKGHIVKVLHISQDTEAPGQFCVVYKCEDGGIWSRPYGMFVSEVDHDKYPDVKQKYRFELVEDAAEKEEFGRWIPCSERLPKPDKYILLSFSNYSGLVIGRYEEDDGGGAFYEGDSLTPLTQYDVFVNAWMPLPEPYREVE